MASFVGFVFHTLPRVGRRILQSLNGPEVDEETDSGNTVVPIPARRPQSASTASSVPSATADRNNIIHLHHPKNAKGLIDILMRGHLKSEINEVEECFGGAPIHSIVRQSSSHPNHTPDCLVALLTYSDADVNLLDKQGHTPLHNAVEMDNIKCVKVLLAFGAEPNALNRDHHTPLDIATARLSPVHLKATQRQTSREWTYVCTEQDGGSPSFPEDVENGTIVSEIHQLLTSVGARHADHLSLPESSRSEGHGVEGSDDDDCPFPGGFSVDEEVDEEEIGGQGEDEEPVKSKVETSRDLTAQERRHNYNMGRNVRKLYRDMENNINEMTNSLMSLRSLDEMTAMQMQRKELVRYRATGARILCLDGGGMKGLIEVDVLEQLQQETGREIAELFDWIVATSTGAIIILSLLYGKKTLREVRQLYYRLKDQVFASPRFGMAYNTTALEGLLIDIFGREMTMEHNSENMPKVIITAVSKKNKTPELVFFNNCLNDNLCHTPVWKVARSTSAAPLMFEEFEDCVDGGVLANNPCQIGLQKIEQSHQDRGEKLPVSLVVSVGSGTYPPEKLGSINVQQYLYFGAHWFKMKDTPSELINNFTELLSNALVESEIPASTTKSQCQDKGIAFHRVSPALDDIIVASEKSNDKLCHMVVSARAKCRVQIAQIVQTLNNTDQQK